MRTCNASDDGHLSANCSHLNERCLHLPLQEQEANARLLKQHLLPTPQISRLVPHTFKLLKRNVLVLVLRRVVYEDLWEIPADSRNSEESVTFFFVSWICCVDWDGRYAPDVHNLLYCANLSLYDVIAWHAWQQYHDFHFLQQLSLKPSREIKICEEMAWPLTVTLG
jgi:hypothetical protein